MKPINNRQLERISEAYQALVKLHPELAQVGRPPDGAVSRGVMGPRLLSLHSRVRTVVPELPSGQQERVINELAALAVGRPALLLKDADFDLTEYTNLPDILAKPLRDNRAAIKTAVQAVGRIEVSNHPQFSWLGTGFVIASQDNRVVVVTNRHVAIAMSVRKGDTFEFVVGADQKNKVGAFLDMKEERTSVEDDASATMPIKDVLYFDEGTPEALDLAFLVIEPGPNAPSFTRLNFGAEVSPGTPVAAIGYPTYDTRGTAEEIVLEYLGKNNGFKRLSPGLLSSASSSLLKHDCTTFGGNSGSPLIDLRTGGLVGLHCGGITYPNPFNRALPAQLVSSVLEKVLRRPITSVAPLEIHPDRPMSNNLPTPQTSFSTSSLVQTLSVEIPIRVTIEVGGVRTVSAQPLQPSDPAPSPATISAAVAEAVARYSALPGVVTVRPGKRKVNGEYSDQDAIVVAVDYATSAGQETARSLAPSIGNFPLEIRPVTLSDWAAQAGKETLVAEGVPKINYVPPENLHLNEVDEVMTAIFHASPDAGWPQLAQFLEGTRESLTIGMYNITADHVKNGLLQAVQPEPRKLDLVLGEASLDKPDVRKYEKKLVKEFEDELGDRFRCERADGAKRLFAGNYHIKVAVRDRKAFWLSSGNWEDSNQPDADPVADNTTSWALLNQHNREWHAIVENAKLAKTFEKYIKYDLESYANIAEAPPEGEEPLFLVPLRHQVDEAPQGSPKYFEPLVLTDEQLRIQPLLTPDNFLEHVTRLVATAEETIEIQNQAVKWVIPNPEKPWLNAAKAFEKFMQVLLDKHNRSPRVKIRFILRDDYAPEMKEFLVWHGFKSSQIRMQSRCHNKGIIVDSKVVVLGSHNLTDHGAMVNRDASLIVFHEKVAQYYRKVFEFDWARDRTQVDEMPPGVRPHRRGDAVPPGFALVNADGVPR